MPGRDCSGVTRRGFVRRAGALTIGGVGGVAVAGRARADHTSSVPEHVSLSFDRSWLEKYRPRLDLSAVEANSEDSPPTAMYAWRASSPEYETDVATYFCEYPYQQGIIPTGDDSHFGDHEPLYVYVDRQSGDVQEVVYSAYHWLRGRTTTPLLYDETHPSFSVVSPWHQYSELPLSGSDGQYVTVEKLGDSSGLQDASVTTTFEDWLSNEDFHDHLAAGTAVDPWTMQGSSSSARGHWWASGGDSFSFNAMFVGLMLSVSSTVPFVDVGGASASDHLE